MLRLCFYQISAHLDFKYYGRQVATLENQLRAITPELMAVAAIIYTSSEDTLQNVWFFY
jgi:hypothetical protein